MIFYENYCFAFINCDIISLEGEDMSQIIVSGDFGETILSSMIDILGIEDLSAKCIHLHDFSLEKQPQYLVLKGCKSLNLTDRQQLDQFKKVIASLQEGLIYNGDINSRIRTNSEIKRINKQMISYGKKERNDFRAVNILESKQELSYDLYVYSERCYHICLPYNSTTLFENSLICFALGYTLGLGIKEIAEKLKGYSSYIHFKNNAMVMIKDCENEREIENDVLELYELDPFDPIYLIDYDSILPVMLERIQALRYVSKYYDRDGYLKHQKELEKERCSLLIITKQKVMI